MLAYYDDHPITAEHVLAAARARGTGLVSPLTADDLFAFDQDHYGGVAAVAVLAARARVRPGARVLDVCAGLAGPARFLTTRFGCRVVALELHAGRARGAAGLTAAVGLAGRVLIVRGDAQRLPFGAARFDACVSQEGFLHVEDKRAVLAGCRRVLVAGGCLAFTDWIARPLLGDRERRRLRESLAAVSLQSFEGYRELLGRADFTAIDAEDVSDEWRTVVRRRNQRHRRIRGELASRLGERRVDALLDVEAFFADLLEGGKVGGARFTATA